jgi:uncharacterized phiE125 gp8 family phage protein
MIAAALSEPPVSMAEAQAYARVQTGEEEALLAGLVRSATELCEAFIGQALVERDFTEVLAASGDWRKLALTPVRSIALVEAVGDDGQAAPLPPTAYAIDIDAQGDGWVRLIDPGSARRVRVTARAGMGREGNAIPEPLRQGILRLVAHLFATRDGGGGEPPAAVTALWRPYRRMRLA